MGWAAEGDKPRPNSDLTPRRYGRAMRAAVLDDKRWWWGAVALACVAGLALRIAAARGALWTDEAWSVIYATDARTPAGVFLRINHDNNHHLYSLWLQAIGRDASPMLARLPAIVAGTAATAVAAQFAARRSRLAGLFAALLFALSPALVTFGSEARGYAPMLLAALVMLLLVDDALHGPPRRGGAWPIALAALVGMLCQLTMAAPVALLSLWVYLDRRGAVGPRAALRGTARLMGPALAVSAATVALVFLAASISPTGMRLGGYLPFAWRDFLAALDDLAAWTAGLSAPFPWLAPIAIAVAALLVALRPPPWIGPRGALYAILILFVPIAAMLLQPGNAGFARYYLVSALGLLLLIAETLAHAIDRKGWPRILAVAALAVVAAGNLLRDAELIRLGRGRADAAVALIAARAPAGASVALAPARLEAALRLAADARRYPLAIARGCGPAPFLIAGHGRFDPTEPMLVRCGIGYAAIASGRTPPLSGDAWTLYAATRLQSVEPPVSGRASQAAAAPPQPAERA